jgi:hypothetical protein
MRQRIRPGPDDLSLDDAVHLVRCRLMELIHAVATADYFDTWLAAVLFRVALDRAERLTNLLCSESSESGLCASRRLCSMRSSAAPILEVAPNPGRDELRRLRTSDPQRDRLAWVHMEQQWRRGLQAARSAIRREMQ